MSKKQTKPNHIQVIVPSDEILSHITNAYGLVCQYRTHNKVPHESIENWTLRLVVEGCNALYKFHNEQLKAQQEQQAKNVEEHKDSQLEQQDNVKKEVEGE